MWLALQQAQQRAMGCYDIDSAPSGQCRLQLIDSQQCFFESWPFTWNVAHERCRQLHVALWSSWGELEGNFVDRHSCDDLGMVHGRPSPHTVVHLPHQYSQGKRISCLHNIGKLWDGWFQYLRNSCSTVYCLFHWVRSVELDFFNYQVPFEQVTAYSL